MPNFETASMMYKENKTFPALFTRSKLQLARLPLHVTTHSLCKNVCCNRTHFQGNLVYIM